VNFSHLMPDPKYGLSKAQFKTSMTLTDHDVVLLTVEIKNEDYKTVYKHTTETSVSVQDCISEAMKRMMEQYIWDTEKK
jgi:hypothetical protein